MSSHSGDSLIEQDPALQADGEREGFSAFPIVGIGASAGGLEAFEQLLSKLPKKPGMAFVLIQHLDPKHESRLTEVLKSISPMPVDEVTQTTKVVPDRVYVIPPDTTLTIEKGTLQIQPRGDIRPHLSVDAFFRSLAKDSQSRAIGVVLSGTGSDGTLGMFEIKAAGGITYAQDKKTAKYGHMPQSAIDSGCVDFVLPPEEIAHSLASIKEHPYLKAAEPEREQPENEFQRVLSIVLKATGVDFRYYRDSTIKRRIQRRMMLLGKRSLADYAAALIADRGEIDALYRDLLINVTGFFRDPEVFEALKKLVFPEIVAGKSATNPIRMWVPGCSTGQEAYSLAIALIEYLDDRPVRPPVQIFATDLSDPGSLERARAGVYPENIESEVSPGRLRRFFKHDGHFYRIDKSIHDLCIFARQNVAADPPFSRVDLISCRNVLIYMSPALQRRVMPTFHYALNHPGFLLLGSSEGVGTHADLFEIVDRSARIYAKKQGAARVPSFAGDAASPPQVALGRSNHAIAGPSDFQKEADRLLLGRFSPPAVLVDEDLNIIQFRGKTSDFLEPPTGEPSTNLMRMAREGLFLELRSALREAQRRHRTVRREGIHIQHERHTIAATIEVVPISLPGSSESRYLVLFDEVRAAGGEGGRLGAGAGEAPRGAAPEVSSGEADGDAGPSSSPVEELDHVRRELAATKDYLQSLLEQQDSVNEELRSANEEILSSNEELQSTNEELETAKEELQSTNEELTTVNEQLHHRNVELSLVNNDLTNLISSTMIPVVMVGGDLRIRRFTVPARRVMNLLPGDIGRPISDINPTVSVPDLEAIIGQVMETVRPFEREITDREGKWWALRVHPYRTTDNKIDGAVLVLLDIDQAKLARESLEAIASDLRTQSVLVDHSQDAIMVMDGSRRIRFWNRGAEQMYGWTKEEAVGQITHEMLKTGGTPVAWIDKELAQSGTWVGELRHARKDGREIIVQSCQVLVLGPEGKNNDSVLEINRDVTDRKRDEQKLRDQADALRQADRRKDEFLAMLAHELRNPLAPVRNALRVLRLSEDNEELQQQARDVLDRQVEQLSRIVDDLLDMTRIAEGKIELRKERVKLSSIVQTAIESSRSMIEARGHKLQIQFHDKPLYLEADPARLAQVLTNLLNNAAKFTDDHGQILLRIGHEPGLRGGPEKVAISVKDSGIGISPEQQAHVFDMFFQADTSLERTRGGLGVGLTLVRSLVARHGGTVEVKSAGVGKGSEFIVHLPLSTPPSGGKEEAPGAVKKPRATSRRVLVVDDNRDQAESLGMLLGIHGHQVRVAFDATQALAIVEAFKPQLVLLDIGLPGMNGYDLARRLREVPALRDTVLVAQTGWGEDADRQRSTDAGIDRHLVKPVDLRVLEEILDGLKN